jgi:hypothetical protein
MLLLSGPLLFVLLIAGAVVAKKAGFSGLAVATIVGVGLPLVLMVTYTTVIWPWLHFG